ncbi:MAG: transcriptional repressor [Coleofasciculus sp. G3-WIS-01]|uniref:transcriptional repressor n=1 Tax=Coleofasciculus sp. G3-WIS-01 TaxID=3069528 RepID=UPI00330389D9
MREVLTANSLKLALNRRNLRMTPQRETILQVFQELPPGEHLSVEDLHDCLESLGKNVSLSTVYRTVKLMVRIGILRELELAEGHKHYELNYSGLQHHHHLVCLQCHQTIEFKDPSILKISQKQARDEDVELLDCQLTLHAVCLEAIRQGWPLLLPRNWSCPRYGD